MHHIRRFIVSYSDRFLIEWNSLHTVNVIVFIVCNNWTSRRVVSERSQIFTSNHQSKTREKTSLKENQWQNLLPIFSIGFLKALWGWIEKRVYLVWELLHFILSCYNNKKKTVNRGAVSVRLEHDGFVRGWVTSAWLRKHLHCLPHICHVWFIRLAAAAKSILIKAVRAKITNKCYWGFDKADIYHNQGNTEPNNKCGIELFIFCGSDIWFKSSILRVLLRHQSDIDLVLLFCKSV